MASESPPPIPDPPAAPRADLVDVLHGVAVADPYRALEDGDDPATRGWTTAQNDRTRAVLDALPRRDELRRRLVQLLSLPMIGAAHVAGERLFAIERGGDRDQSVLTVRAAVSGGVEPDESRVLIDPQRLLDEESAALDWYHPSPDGALVAFGISVGGDERSVLRILDTASGQLRDDTIPDTRAASVAWAPDASGFAYTRYPAAGEVPDDELGYWRRVWWHELGAEPAADTLLFDQLPDPTAWPDVTLSPDGEWFLVHVAVGWGRVDVFLRHRSDDAWTTVVAGIDAVTGFRFDDERERLVGTTTLDAPRGRVIEAPLDHPQSDQWRTLVAESEAVIEGITTTPNALLVVRSRSAMSELLRCHPDGSAPEPVALPEPGSIGALSASRERDEVWLSFTSFTRPEQLFCWTPAGLVARSEPGDGLDPEAYRVEQVRYPSTDGTSIAMFLISPVVSGPGPKPVILTGYGGFAITMSPAFSPLAVAHCDAGGTFAVAGIRGGSEEGEEWHQAGQREHKQQVFDDFIAAADWLVATGRATRDQLAIRGGSNGGLLVGAALTQRPDLCRAVHCAVPLLDMVRYTRFLIARLWIPEYGDPDLPDEFAWLYAYSPYHHVEDGVAYPAVLITTGEEDSRVDPAHARKMAARLQDATSAGADRPILLRVEARAGHGQGKPVSRQADELVDVGAFLWWQTGVTPPA